jgi:hypothetical protein
MGPCTEFNSKTLSRQDAKKDHQLREPNGSVLGFAFLASLRLRVSAVIAMNTDPICSIVSSGLSLPIPSTFKFER